mgnify:FL=1
MTRPIERIKPILKIIEEAWMQNPDMRLWQLLLNPWISFHTEDLTDFVHIMSWAYGTTPLLWGTYWKDWKSPLKYIPLEEMETLHLANILQTQAPVPWIEKVIKNEILKRSK